MKVVFRVDSSTEIGSGHLMRCLALAEQLRKAGKVEIFFISRDLPGNLSYLVREHGFLTHMLPFTQPNGTMKGYARWLGVSQKQDAQETADYIQLIKASPDWVVVDSYAIGLEWEQILRPYVQHVFVIDDLANRLHDCDAFLDQIVDEKKCQYYADLIPKTSRKFLGPQYALFREEFFSETWTKEYRIANHPPKSAMVTFGGSDLTNETEKVLRALSRVKQSDIVIHVVVGGSNPRKEIIRNICTRDNRFKYYCQIDYMARLLRAVDFVIGAAGTSLWEWCFLQVPSLVIVTAENQNQCEDYQSIPDLCVYLGEAAEVTAEHLYHVLKNIFMGKQELNHVQAAYKKYFPHGSQMKEIVEYMFERAAV